MDAPLVLSSRLILEEVDDEVFAMDVVEGFPLSFYQETLKYSSPKDVDVEQVEDRMGTGRQYEGINFSYKTSNMNSGTRVSAYKTLSSIPEKVDSQLDISKKIREVDEKDATEMIVNKHFMKDIKGNLRGYTMQKFRCTSCNTTFRRVPLQGKCPECGGNIVFTIAEGTVSKYLDQSLKLAEEYQLSDYTKQVLDLLDKRVESVFGKEPTKQTGLSEYT